MLWTIAFALIIAVTFGFMAMSYRFERASGKKRLKALSCYPLISVLIPTYNSEKTVRKTLESVVNSDYPNKEIIVINDSRDGTPGIARMFGAKVIQNSKRMGKAAALNQAAEEASGEFLMVLDSDTTLRKCAMTTLMKSYEDFESRGERVGIVAPKYAARNRRNIFARLSDIEQRMHQGLMRIQMNMGSILSIRGSCMLVNRKAFDDVGGFSNTLLEDGDFTAKIIKAGYKIKYEPKAMVSIKEPETLASLLRAKKRYGKGTLYCAIRHVRPYVISPQSFVCFFPQFLLMLALLGISLYQNPLTIAPIAMLLTSFTISGITSYITIAAIGMLSIIGMLVGTQTITATNVTTIKSGLLGTLLPFVLFFVPLVTFAYITGAISGISDKIHNRPELEFSNW